MRTYNLVSFLILSTLLLSCTKKTEFKKFDAAAWSSDGHGCGGVRKGLIESPGGDERAY